MRSTSCKGMVICASIFHPQRTLQFAWTSNEILAQLCLPITEALPLMEICARNFRIMTQFIMPRPVRTSLRMPVISPFIAILTHRTIVLYAGHLMFPNVLSGHHSCAFVGRELEVVLTV